VNNIIMQLWIKSEYQSLLKNNFNLKIQVRY
jgi:hypothetical protein